MSSRYSGMAVLLAGLLVQPLVGPATLRAADTPIARGKLVQRRYSVGDLICVLHSRAPGGAAAQLGPESALINLITRMVTARTWSDNGGPGTIDYFPLGMTLVINQTPAVHEQIEVLLKTLRTMQDREVACEVRIVSLDEDFCKRIAGDLGIPAKAGTRVTFLDEDQTQKFFETIQSDARTNVMQAPKITMLNGQEIPLRVYSSQFFVTGVDVSWDGEQVRAIPKNTPIETGFGMTLQPVIAADGKSVQLHLQARSTGLEKVGLSPVAATLTPVSESGARAEPVMFTQFIQTPKVVSLSTDKMLSIPEGQTAVLSGWTRKREVCKKSAVPVLSELPRVGSLFQSERQETVCERVLLLVTPKVMLPAQQAPERIQGGIE